MGLSERIGELRSMLVEHEKSGAKLEAETQKAIELIKQVKPEEILKQVTQFDAKIEVLRARIESNEKLIYRMIEELKEMRRTFIQFKNLNEVVKLSEDFKKDLSEAKKIEARMEKFSSNVETIFAEIQKRYKEFLGLSKSVEDLKRLFRELTKEFDKLKIQFVGVARQEDLRKLEERIANSLKEAEALSSELKKRREELKEIIASSGEVARISERVSSLLEAKRITEEKLKVLDDLIESFSKLKAFVEKFDSRIVLLEEFKERAVTKAQIEDMKRKIEEKLFELDKLATNASKSIKSVDERLNEITKVKESLAEGLKKLSDYEKALKTLEKRQATLLKLIEEIA